MRIRGLFFAALALTGVIAACATNDLTEDPLKADAGSGLTCPTTCTGGQKCCKVGQRNFCITTAGDPLNCGDCGAACDRHRANQCVGGKCKCGSAAAACDVGKECCPAAGGAATCLDLKSDNNNCGTCGHTCPAGSTCQNGGCVCAAGTHGCTSTQTCCGSGCADTNTDDNNCGSCDTKCGDAHCMTGECMCHIAIIPGVVYADDTCTHFGAGNPFIGPDCCGESCVDRQTSATNCGACGNTCSPMLFSFPLCVGGSCI